MSFEIGQRFYSFKELQDELEQYSKLHNVHFFIRDGNRLETSQRVPRCQIANPDLIYYKVKFACVYGGRRYIKTCLQRKVHSYKYGCEAFINVLLSGDGMALEVTRLNLEHNHPDFKAVPKLHTKDSPLTTRRLKRLLNSSKSTEAEKQFARQKLQKLSPPEEDSYSNFEDESSLISEVVQSSPEVVPPPKKVPRSTHKLMPQSDRKVVPHSNRKVVPHSTHKVVQLAAIEKKVDLSFKEICEKNSCSVTLLLRDDDLKIAFLQDEEMKNTFNTFPEVFYFNRTCTITDVRLVCFTFLTIGIEGVAEVIALGLVAKEDKESLDWLLNTFKENNENWCKTQIVMTDKDLVELDLFKDSFPQAAVSICRYSVLQIFNQEATTRRMKTSQKEITKAEKLILEMCHSANEETYMDSYSELQSLPKTLKEYFDRNWHPIREEWTCISYYENTFINILNNQLESFNSKLNHSIGDLSNLEEFIGNYFAVLNSLREEKYNASVNPRHVKRCEQEEAVEYYELLVPYAFDSVLRQLKYFQTGELVEVLPSQYYFSQDKILFRVDPNTCDCIFTKAMRLPCKHIFTVRRKMNMSVFDPGLVDPRWIKPVLLNEGESCPPESNELMSGEPEAVQDENNSENEQNMDVEQEKCSVGEATSVPESNELISDGEPATKHNENNPQDEQNMDLEQEGCSTGETAIVPGSNELISIEPGDKHDENNPQDEQNIDLEPESFASRKTAALKLTNMLAESIAKSTGEAYEDKMKLLEKILNHWEKGGGVTTFTLLQSPGEELINGATGLPYKTILPKPSGYSVSNSSAVTSSQSLNQQDNYQAILRTCNATSSESLNRQNQVISTNFLMNSKGPKTFERLPLFVQQEIILSWFIDKNLVSSVINNGVIIEENHVTAVPDEVPTSCIDKNVNLSSVQPFFTEDAFKLVTSLVELKKILNFPKCSTCGKSASESSVKCRCCLMFYHIQCDAYKLHPDKFCKKCMIDCPGNINDEPQCFEDLPLQVRQRRILSWFVDENLATRIVNNGGKVEATDVVSEINEVPVSCLDKKADFSVVKNFFSEDAWKLVINLVNLKGNKTVVRRCAACNSTFKQLFKCKSCLLYYDHQCIAYIKYPLERRWFCKTCKTGNYFSLRAKFGLS